MAAARLTRKASRVLSRTRAAFGTIVVEGDVLVFRPNPIERKLEAGEWSVPLSEVTGFRVSPVDLRDLLAGGLRPRLALDLGRDHTELFVVRDPKALAAELLQLAVRPVDPVEG